MVSEENIVTCASDTVIRNSDDPKSDEYKFNVEFSLFLSCNFSFWFT